MKILLVLCTLCFLLLSFSTIAQETKDCSTLVTTAILSLDQLCHETERNQACYGHQDLEAQAQPNISNFEFDSEGDITNVANIHSLRLRPLDEAHGVWGVALMKLQANLPDTLPGQNVTLVLFGDVSLENANETNGFTPMQAFYFASGIGDSACAEMPESGILIQTTGNGGSVHLKINGAEVELGSTAFLQSNPETGMVVYLLEGEALVSAFDVEQVVPAGAKLTLPVDETMGVSGPPTSMEPFSEEEVSHLEAIVPILPENVPIIGAFEFAEIEVSACESGGFSDLKPGEWAKIVQAVSQAPSQEEAQSFIENAHPIFLDDVKLPTYFGPIFASADGTSYNVQVYAFWQTEVGAHSLTTSGEEGDISCDLAIELETIENPSGNCVITAGGVANLRGGPGTNYPRVGTLAASEQTQPQGQAQGTDGHIWWLVSDGRWVRSDVVSDSGDCASLPVMTDIPPTPIPPPPSTGGGGSGSSNLPNFVLFHPWGCDLGPPGSGNTGAVRAGNITFMHGVGGFNSCEEAFAAVGGSYASFSGDGPGVSIDPERNCHGPEGGTGYGAVTIAYVTLFPGTYSYNTEWIHGARTCTFRVE